MGIDRYSKLESASTEPKKRRTIIAKRRGFSVTTCCALIIIMALSLFYRVAAFSFEKRVTVPMRRQPLRGNHLRHYHGSTVCHLNRFLFSPEEMTMSEEKEVGESSEAKTGEVILPKDDYRTIHAAKILGLKNGDSIRAGLVGDGNGNGNDDGNGNGCAVGLWTDEATIQWLPEPPVKKAEVLKNGNPPGSLSIRLTNLQSIDDAESRPSAASDPINVSLILALPRPLQLGRILPMISQIGVDHLVLTSAKKVPKDYFGSHLFRKPEVLREKLIEGLCQAGDVRLPKLHVVKNLRHYLRSEDFERMFPRHSCARVLTHPKRHDDPTEPLRMSEVEFPITNTNAPPRIVVAVGPEGGWEEPTELDVFTKECGFQQITLGSRTLRSDVAVSGLLTLAHEACHAKSIEIAALSSAKADD